MIQIDVLDTDEEAGAQQDIKAKVEADEEAGPQQDIKDKVQSDEEAWGPWQPSGVSRKGIIVEPPAVGRKPPKNAPPVLPTHPPGATMAAGIMCTRLRGPEPEILVIKRKHAKCWEFPKGRRNIGEDLKMTAIREFQEETGVNLKFLDKGDLIELGSQTYSTRYEDKKTVKWYWTHFHVHIDHQFQHKEYGTEQMAWFTETQLQRDIYIKGGEDMLELAKKALDFVRHDKTTRRR